MKNFTLSANTLSRTVKDNRADRIEVEIGDSKQPDFKPQFKIKRWDNEVNFSMRAIEEAGATMVEKDGKVKYKGKDIEVHQYEKTEAGEDGGFEFEWVLNKKPKSNVLRTTIQHKGLDFFYQPALTAEEIEQGASRDENVVGSYAVYHSTKQNNIVGGMEYQTGKAFHIYRPHAVDAKGVKVWCELDIKEGELTVTVPEDFLNKASYPVVVDPTFGYTSVGGTQQAAHNSSFDGFAYRATQFNLGEGAEVTSMSAYMAKQSVSGHNPVFLAQIYSDDSDYPDNREGYTNTFALSTTPGWETATFGTNPTLTTADFWLGVNYVSGAGIGPLGQNRLSYIYYDSTSNLSALDSLNLSSGNPPPDPMDSDVSILSGGSTRSYSIYATYTATSPPSSYNPAFAHRRLLL